MAIAAGKYVLALSCGSLFLSGIWLGRPVQQEDVKIVVHAVAGPIAYLEGQGGNIGVCSGSDGVLMIDDQFEALAEKIQSAIDAITKSPLRFVLNTHYHGDHTGGNPAFGRKAPILAQENVRVRLLAKTGGQEMAPAGLPLLTYDDGVMLHMNGEEIRVVHYPKGHTDGDSVVYFTTSKVVHTGDLYFNGRFPFVDLDAGGSVRGTLANVGAILKELPPDGKVIPGHGPLSTPAELKAWRDALADCVALVEQALASGKSVEEMKQEKVLAKHAELAWNFVSADRFIDTLARELAPKK